MRRPDISEFRQLLYDLGAFVFALIPRTIAAITGGGLAAALAVYCIFGFPVYAWIAWLFLILVVLVAAFSAWRDLYTTVYAQTALPCLTIEGISLNILKSSERYQCQVRIYSTRTADNVQLELLSLEDEFPQLSYFVHPVLPVTLKPEIDGANTINPGSSQKFNLFQVVKSDVANNFLCYFTDESTKDVAIFKPNKYYRIKLITTARELPKTTQEFFVYFPSKKGEFRQFNLITVTASSEKDAKASNRAIIIEVLAQYRVALLNRAAEIKKIPSDRYHEENKDGDTNIARIFEEIKNVFESNPIDLGANAIADFESIQNMDRTPIHNTYGKTIYDDDWQWIQQLLINREKNLVKIIDKLNLKPL